MRYTVRTLMIAIAVVSVPLGFMAIYDSIWKSHCRSLEPSLFAMILQDELNEELDLAIPEFEFEGVVYNQEPPASLRKEIYFAVGQSDEGDWISPSPGTLEKIGLSSVKPASEMSEGNIVHYIENIRWVDWDTVIIDHGEYGGPLYGGGAENVKLQYSDGEWQIIEHGSFWVI